MKGYTIVNRITYEVEFIVGYDLADAFRRSRLNPSVWKVVGQGDNTMKRKTIESGFGYRIYFYRDTFFVEIIGKDKCDGFSTIQGAREHAYYMGFRDSKD